MKRSPFLLTVCLVGSIGISAMIPPSTSADDSRDELDLLLKSFLMKALRDRHVVHPTDDERQAVTKMLEMRPRPASLSQDELAFLRSLKGDDAWTGAQERTMHKIWEEVMGKQWTAPNPRK